MNTPSKLLTAMLCLALGNIAHAADWTPVFKPWENGCESSQVERSMSAYISYEYFNTDAYVKAFDNNGNFKLAGQKNHAKLQTLFTNNNAKQGKYPKVKTPYRNDLGKAVLSRSSEGDMELSIPLKNAKLYGHSIVKYTNYFLPDTGISGSYITFGTMSNADYQKLKKIKMNRPIDEFDDQFSAKFNRNSKGVVTLTCDFST